MTKEQIKEGLDKAYQKAGHNAYFGNGFEAGVKFALDAQNTSPSIKYKQCPMCGAMTNHKDTLDQYWCPCCHKIFAEHQRRKNGRWI